VDNSSGGPTPTFHIDEMHYKLLKESRLVGKETAIGVASLPKQDLSELLAHLPLLK